MRNISCLAGVKELDNINRYTMEELAEEEKPFIKRLNKTVEDFQQGKSDDFISCKDLIELRRIWQKYEHTKPFQFRFDPREKMPKVFKNRTAFIIWTAWKSRHLVCEDDDIKGGSLAVAKILLGHKPPFPEEVKEEAVKEFLRHLHGSYTHLNYTEKNELDFWNKWIFPYLERKWKFRWKLINN